MDTQDPEPMRKTEEEQKKKENILKPVPPMDFSNCALEDKSLHHQCTYSDCQVTGSMFFDNPSKNVIQRHAHISFIVSATFIMHQTNMDIMQIAYP